MKHPLVPSIAMLLALTLSACDATDTLGPTAPTGVDLSGGSASSGQSLDWSPQYSHNPGGGGPGSGSLFDDLAEKIPGFGGLYRTGECAVAVVLTDMSQARLAQQVVHAALAPIHPCHGQVEVSAVRGKFTYYELQAYLAASRPLLQIEGVLHVKINYKLNRLVVTVTSHEAARRVLALLPRLGIPSDAVVIHGQRPGATAVEAASPVATK